MAPASAVAPGGCLHIRPALRALGSERLALALARHTPLPLPLSGKDLGFSVPFTVGKLWLRRDSHPPTRKSTFRSASPDPDLVPWLPGKAAPVVSPLETHLSCLCVKSPRGQGRWAEHMPLPPPTSVHPPTLPTHCPPGIRAPGPGASWWLPERGAPGRLSHPARDPAVKSLTPSADWLQSNQVPREGPARVTTGKWAARAADVLISFPGSLPLSKCRPASRGLSCLEQKDSFGNSRTQMRR